MIVHKIHRPDVIGRIRNNQRKWLLPLDSPLGLYPQVQFQFAVNTVNPFVVPAVPLDVAQVVTTQAKASVLLIVRQQNQPVGDRRVLVRQDRPLTIAGLADTKGPAD